MLEIGVCMVHSTFIEGGIEMPCSIPDTTIVEGFPYNDSENSMVSEPDISLRQDQTFKFSWPEPNSTLSLHTKIALSQHVRTESIFFTLNFCRKVLYGESPTSPITSLAKLICTASAAASLLATGKLTSTIEKSFGPVAETTFDLAAMTTIYYLSTYSPPLANKFNQASLLTGIAGGVFLRAGLVKITGQAIPTASSALDFASNDMITGMISLGAANLLASQLADPSMAANIGQATYRILDVPLNFLVTMATNSIGSLASATITLGSFAARARTHDLVPNKTSFDLMGLFVGLTVGAAYFTGMPWFRSSPESEEPGYNQLPYVCVERVCPSGELCSREDL